MQCPDCGTGKVRVFLNRLEVKGRCDYHLCYALLVLRNINDAQPFSRIEDLKGSKIFVYVDRIGTQRERNFCLYEMSGNPTRPIFRREVIDSMPLLEGLI